MFAGLLACFFDQKSEKSFSILNNESLKFWDSKKLDFVMLGMNKKYMDQISDKGGIENLLISLARSEFYNKILKTQEQN